MPYTKRVILHAPHRNAPSLVDFVENCIRDGVVLICILGDDCQSVADVIDELVVADGFDENRFICTSAHPNESLEKVRDFAGMWTQDVDPHEAIQEVQLDGN